MQQYKYGSLYISLDTDTGNLKKYIENHIYIE
jgi:hypothetical protein